MKPKHPIQELLKAVHSNEGPKLDEITVVIVHRGAPNDEKKIEGRRIVEVHKGYFEYENEIGETVHIPAHRIKRIEYH